MTPELGHCFSITIQVDKPIIVSRSPQTGKRQLIPIVGGSVSGQLRGHVLPGGVDSQIIEPDGTCRLSAPPCPAGGGRHGLCGKQWHPPGAGPVS